MESAEKNWVWGLLLFVVQLPSRVWLFATPWTAARQASLSLAISWSLPKLMFIALMTPDLWQKKKGGGRKKEKDTEDLVIKMGRDLSSASRCQSSELQGCGLRNSGNSVGICWNWVGRNVGTNMIFLRKCFSQPEAMTTEEAAATDTRAQDKTFLLMKDCGDGWLY